MAKGVAPTALRHSVIRAFGFDSSFVDSHFRHSAHAAAPGRMGLASAAGFAIARPVMEYTPPPPQVMAEGKFIRLIKQGKWEYATRKGISGIVGIVAVTDDRKLILVEQDRPPVAKRVIELPAGLAGDVEGQADEELSVAARRELLEETGYEAAEMTHLTEGAASAGMTDEVITLFLARGLRKTGEGKGDGSEDITVHEVPVDDVIAWLDARRGAGLLIDVKVYAGLYFATRPAGRGS